MQEIAILDSASPENRGVELNAFFNGLKAEGVTGSADLVVSYAWANNDYSKLTAIAQALVARGVKVIVAAGGTVSAIAAKKAAANTSIPVVFTAVTDAQANELVGPNLIGTVDITSALDLERLATLRQHKSENKPFGVLVNSGRPGHAALLTRLQNTAAQLNLQLVVQSAAKPSEIDPAFNTFAQSGVAGLLVTSDPFFNSQRDKIVECANSRQIATIYQWREFVTAGGLMSFGPSIAEAYHRAGEYAGRIFKGIAINTVNDFAQSRTNPTSQVTISASRAHALGIQIPAGAEVLP
jgi:putative ABC transport system substrate-binding protein